jgi:hypothetical protein
MFYIVRLQIFGYADGSGAERRFVPEGFPSGKPKGQPEGDAVTSTA